MGAAEIGDHAAARCALEEAELEQVGLVDVLDRLRLLAERDGERREPDRSAAELDRDRAEELAVGPLEAEAADEIARRARGTPRVANRILKRVRDVAQVRHAGVITSDVAREALELLEVDLEGLERTDRELLRAIVDKFGGGPVGLSTLAVALGEEPDTIEDVYEPYLLQLGFIQRTARGRIVTELGRTHVGAADGGDAKLF